ncbi:glycosyltransferase family 4 protein [Halorubrum rubrum]|uniref:Glycosyltransferase family 4 protein n=1 Tax=Halorubrum rubrum TaxID=1126240 RepID=A0ABD5R508_9EURY|nr:glycosyltransferase family 4 protein [Halorubrum rubrum]
MNILQLGTIPKEKGAFKESGGVATHVWQLATHLTDSDHSVIVFADNYLGKQYIHGEFQVIGRSVRNLPIGLSLKNIELPDIVEIITTYRSLGVVRVIHMIVYYIFLTGIYHKTNPDVVHAHELRFRHYVASLVVDENTPLIATSHSVHSITYSEPKKAEKYRSILQRSYAACDHLIYVSNKLRCEVEEHVGSFDGHSQVIYNSINNIDKNIQDNEQKTEEHTLLYVGEFTERKGVYRTIDATILSYKKVSDLKLVIIGSDDTEKIEKYIKDQQVKDIVSVPGRVDDVDKWYSKADLLVVPTRSESFGLVFLEAMQHGIPVIGTTEVPEPVIPNKHVGYRVPPDDIEQISNVIVNSYTQEWQHQKIQDHARSFSWNEQISKYEEFYRESLRIERTK